MENIPKANINPVFVCVEIYHPMKISPPTRKYREREIDGKSGIYYILYTILHYYIVVTSMT